MTRHIPLLISSALALALAGCGRKQTHANSAGIWGPASYGSFTAGKVSAPGVDQGSMLMGYCYWPGKPTKAVTAFAVWVGVDGGGGCSSFTEHVPESPLARRCVFDGTIAKVPVLCRTPDGVAGTIKIGDETFQLAQGGLFLVSTASGKPVVRQLPLTHLNLKPGEHPTIDGLKVTAAQEPVISEFFKGSASK